MADSRPIVVPALRGLDERWNPPRSEGGGLTAAVATDLWFDPRGGWQSAGGYKRVIRGPEVQEAPGTYLNPFRNSGAIESIHWFSQHNGARRWLIYIDGGGNLYQFNPSTAARTGSPGDAATDRAGNTLTRSVVTSPWQRNQSACWGDQFYLVNGIDRPVTFNGYVWDYAGWSGPAGTPTATTMSHPHAVDSGSTDAIKIPNIGLGPTSETGDQDYPYARRYRVSYVNDRGAESPLSEPSEIIYFENIGGTTQSCGAHFAKVSVPIGDASCVARRVYATQSLYDSSGFLITGRDTQFYFHSEIQDNCTATVMDSLADGFLGSLVDPTQFGAWPMGAKYIASFKGRMYATGTGNSSVFYSKRGNPEVWPVNNEIDVGDANLGPTTAIYATRNVLVVAKARGLYLIEDDGVNEPVARTLTREAGWSAQNTVREIPGIGLMGLSDDGITLLKGTLQNEGVETQTFNAAVGLPDTFARLNRAAILNACAAVYHRDKEYWLVVPTLGHPTNNLVLVFHYEIREWTTRPYYPISSILETPDPAGNLIFSSYAASAGISPDGVAHLGIFVYTRGAADKDGTAITPVYQTNQISIASAYRTFRPLHVLVRCILHGSNDLTENVYSNYGLTGWLTTASSVDQQYPQDPSPVYGTAAFDDGTLWQQWRPGTLRFDIEDPSRGPVMELAVRWTPAARYMTLFGFSLEVSPEDPIQTKPLKPDQL
jgi:hypothetical protein